MNSEDASCLIIFLDLVNRFSREFESPLPREELSFTDGEWEATFNNTPNTCDLIPPHMAVIRRSGWTVAVFDRSGGLVVGVDESELRGWINSDIGPMREAAD